MDGYFGDTLSAAGAVSQARFNTFKGGIDLSSNSQIVVIGLQGRCHAGGGGLAVDQADQIAL